MRTFFVLIILFFSIQWLLAGVPAKTMPDSIPSYKMSEIVVVADQLSGASISTLYEVNSGQITALDVRNVQQALQFTPGFYFSRTSKNEASFRLRGFEQRQVNVFLDGVPVVIPYDGTLDISQLAGDNIQNIRVSKGLPSTLYGANTLGGTVNIITGAPQNRQALEVRAEGSDHGRMFGSIRYQGSLGKLKYLTSFSVENSPNFKLPGDFQAIQNEAGGKRDNSASNKKTGSLKLFYNLNAAHQFGLHVNAIDNRYDVPPRALIKRPRYWQFPEWNKNVFSLNSRHVLGNHLVLRSVLYYDKYRNVLESYDNDGYNSQTFRYAFSSVYDDHSLGGVIYPQLNWFSFGTTNGMFSYKQDVHRENSGAGTPFAKYAMDTWAAGLEQDARFSDALGAVVGVDLNYLNPTQVEAAALRDPIFLMNAQIAMQYKINSGYALHLSLGRKSRFPTLKELYSERLGRNISNPELKEELSLNKEVALKWNGEKTHIHASVFHNDLSDLIANKQLGDNIQQLQNIDEATIYGFELDVSSNFSAINLNANYTYLNAENTSENRSVDYLEYRPKHQLNGIVQINLNKRIALQMEGTYSADQHYQNPDTGVWEKLNDFGLFAAKLNYRVCGHLNLYLRANNLFDRSYFSEFGVPMPGREIISGVRFNL